MTALSLKFILHALAVTGLMAGCAAWVSGRALARSWLPLATVLPVAFGLALAARFIDYALFAEAATWLRLLLDTVATLAIAGAGYHVTRTDQMLRQYPWLDRS